VQVTTLKDNTKLQIEMGNCQNVQAVHHPLEYNEFLKRDRMSGVMERIPLRDRLPKEKMEDDTTMVTADASTSILSSNERSMGNGLSECHLKKKLLNIDFNCSTLMGAIREAERLNKPILCFDVDLSIPDHPSIPQNVFSHPLLVEAIESSFVSVVQGLEISSYTYTDREFRVRVLDKSGCEIIGLGGNQICLASLTAMLVSGLTTVQIEVPKYLSLLEAEENGKVRQLSDGTLQRTDRQTIFGMSDSKIGEIEFADLEGIIATKAGYVSKQKVVKVIYDSIKLSFCNLVRFALQRQISDIIYYHSNEQRIAARVEVERVKGDNDLIRHLGTIQVDINPKHSLGQTMLRYVPLTDLQALKANNLASRGVFNEATHLLSPRQGVILMKSLQNTKKSFIPSLVDAPITQVWKKKATGWT